MLIIANLEYFISESCSRRSPTKVTRVVKTLGIFIANFHFFSMWRGSLSAHPSTDSINPIDFFFRHSAKVRPSEVGKEKLFRFSSLISFVWLEFSVITSQQFGAFVRRHNKIKFFGKTFWRKTRWWWKWKWIHPIRWPRVIYHKQARNEARENHCSKSVWRCGIAITPSLIYRHL